MTQCSTLSGHTISKQSMVERRRGVYMTVLHDLARFVSLPKRMPTVWIKQVLIYSTLLPPLRTYWYTGPTSLMRLPKPFPQNRGFTSGLIVRSMNGGSSIKAALQSPPVKLSRSSWRCRGTRNLHVVGRNMPTRYYVRSVSPPRFTNHVYTRGSSMITEFSSCGKLTILLLRHRTSIPPKS